MRDIKKYSRSSSRGCGFVEKWIKSRRNKGATVDKMSGLVLMLSTVYTDKEWMSYYPQNIHMK
ncbi:hypothetical protein HMPREF1992_01450 [Selenomonas sp. oral taxon 892 str. F0426]|nr:hypothetical protein HMPREF1992_01450 [Selenomonas sp. oral taxon 892 str. F0426]